MAAPGGVPRKENAQSFSEFLLDPQDQCYGFFLLFNLSFLVLTTKHQANLNFHFLMGGKGRDERGLFIIWLYLIYGFTLDTGEYC